MGKLNVGESITWANEKDINSPEDLYAFEDSNFTGVFRFMHAGNLELAYVNNGYLGITVTKPSSIRERSKMALTGSVILMISLNPLVRNEIVSE